METTLTILGASLGIIVPALSAFLLRLGISSSPLDASTRARWTAGLFGILLAWTAAVFASSIGGLLSYHEGDIFPRFVIALVGPFAVGIALMTSSTYRTIIDHIPLAWLAGAQAFRFAGTSLFAVVALGILPTAFAVGGVGDLLTAALALFAGLALASKSRSSGWLFWGYNAAGLIDLVNVAALLLFYYPIWSDAPVSSAAAADFSLVMIPAVAAPMALLMHTYAIKRRLLGPE